MCIEATINAQLSFGLRFFLLITRTSVSPSPAAGPAALHQASSTLLDMSDLQREIAKRKKAEDNVARICAIKESKPYPWPPGAWKKASEDILNGTFKSQPTPRVPVLLDPNGPVSSPSQLQALAMAESLPEVMVTHLVNRDGQEVGSEVQICYLSLEEWETTEERAVVSRGIFGDRLVMSGGKPRAVAVVESLHEGVTLELVGETVGVVDREQAVDQEQAVDAAEKSETLGGDEDGTEVIAEGSRRGEHVAEET